MCVVDCDSRISISVLGRQQPFHQAWLVVPLFDAEQQSRTQAYKARESQKAVKGGCPFGLFLESLNDYRPIGDSFWVVNSSLNLFAK